MWRVCRTTVHHFPCDVDFVAHHHSGLFCHLVTFLECTTACQDVSVLLLAYIDVFWELCMKFIFCSIIFFSCSIIYFKSMAGYSWIHLCSTDNTF